MRLKWDYYSDQPEVIKDRALKKRIYKSIRWDSFKMVLTNIALYPVAFIVYLLLPTKKKLVDCNQFFGMSVNFDKNPLETQQLIQDLDAQNLLIRVPLHDIENLSSYVRFAEKFKDKNLLINILQDRRHVEDLTLLKSSLRDIFQQFSHLTHRFQIANAINRKKWAIFSMDEFLSFYKVAYNLKQKEFPKLVLLGASIIDFEYYFTLRTLFNWHKVHFDECSSLLYVDRRGAPENTQMGLDLVKKLHLLQAILRLSPKTGTDIVITETNWPISQTAPYAPTSEEDCVSLEKQADFLVRYYLLSIASGVVKQVFWHQLIAPGYGLLDNRNDKLVKYPSYQAFKTMLSQLQRAEFHSIDIQNGLYHLFFTKNNTQIEVLWSLTSHDVDCAEKQLLSIDGKPIEPKTSLEIGSSPVYFISESNEKSS